ncbi:MAG: MFS transporter [Desulfobacterales bacterium]|nr:MFS transporter [Desulfobacterales bacterium]
MQQDYESSMTANIRRYPWYLFFRDCYFWGPAFFLYFSSMMSLTQVLWLEAVYYVGVAVMEVPSGYISDRFGRKMTLVASSVCLAIAYLLFFTGTGFYTFIVAQVFMSAGFAAASGTDTALHYESLKGLNRESEYADLEGRALGFSFRAGALGALAGGFMAVADLRWIYAASFAASLISLFIALGFTTPGRKGVSQKNQGHIEPAPPAMPMGRQVYGLLGKALSRRFRFFTLYTLSMTLLVHLPYEFYQPYLERVTQELNRAGTITPGVAGVHLALTMLAGSLFTRFAGKIHFQCRIKRTLLACTLFQAVLVGAMALVFHPSVVLLLVFRTVSKAISIPLVNAEVSPLLKRDERSTYLSLQSLLGRLAYGLVLLVLPLGATFFTDEFHGALICASGLGLFLWLMLQKTAFHEEPARECCGRHSHPAAGTGK